VFLGTCALVDAVWAVVGEDPLSEVLGVLLPVLDGAVPGLEGRVVADALIGAFAGTIDHRTRHVIKPARRVGSGTTSRTAARAAGGAARRCRDIRAACQHNHEGTAAAGTPGRTAASK
jgi:hypothetical protein